MRRLMWFTVGFAAACLLCTHYLWDRNLLLAAVILAIIGIVSWIPGKRIVQFAAFSNIFWGIGIGFLWFTAFSRFYIQPIVQFDGQTIHAKVTAVGYSEQSRFSPAVDAVISLNGIPYKTIVYLNQNLDIEPGDVLEFDYRLRLTTPEGAKESTYHQGTGLFLISSQKGEVKVSKPDKMPLWCLPARIARDAKDNIRSCFPEDTSPFAKALLLGDTDDLSYAEDTALKVSGIRHMVAVSGLHVSIIFGLIILIFRFHRILTPLITIPVLLFFAAMTGFTPSVTRACIMTSLMALSLSLWEEYDALTGLAFACLLMLLCNPFAVTSISFQLSVASVAGILLFSASIYEWTKKHFSGCRKRSFADTLANWFSSSFSVSAGSLITTLPLCAYYFGTISLVGVFTNLLTIWLVSFTFCMVAFVGAFGGILPVICSGFAGVASWFIRYILGAAKVLSSFRFSAVYTQSVYIVSWIVFCYILLGLFLILKKKHVKYYLFTGGLVLVFAVILSVWIPKMDSVRMTVIDVGEGQSILLQSDGQYFLVDCGGNNDETTADRVAQTLLSQGITRLDGIALTHYDRDHSGALMNLLTRIDADMLYLPDMEDGGFRDTVSGIQIQMIAADTVYRFGKGTLTLTAPGKLKSTNENCMCVLFESPKCVILITGDRGTAGEKELIASTSLPDVDVLIGGHHGSKNATSEELLRAVTPEIVVFSVGANNSYGHPAQEVLERLTQYNCKVYRTDLNGSIVIRRTHG